MAYVWITIMQMIYFQFKFLFIVIKIVVNGVFSEAKKADNVI